MGKEQLGWKPSCWGSMVQSCCCLWLWLSIGQTKRNPVSFPRYPSLHSAIPHNCPTLTSLSLPLAGHSPWNLRSQLEEIHSVGFPLCFSDIVCYNELRSFVWSCKTYCFSSKLCLLLCWRRYRFLIEILSRGGKASPFPNDQMILLVSCFA